MHAFRKNNPNVVLLQYVDLDMSKITSRPFRNCPFIKDKCVFVNCKKNNSHLSFLSADKPFNSP